MLISPISGSVFRGDWQTWIDWFNHRRLLGPIGNIPPAEAEANYYQELLESAKAA
jgi:putative transposase